SDNDGTFMMYGVPPGQYVARVVRIPWPSSGDLGVAGGTGALRSIMQFGSGPAPGAAPAPAPPEPLMSVTVPVIVGDRDVTGLNMRLRPGARITGHAEFEGSAARP